MIPGTRIEMHMPAGPGERFGPDPLIAGEFYHVSVSDGTSRRARLESFTTYQDGKGLSVVFEIVGPYETEAP